MIRQVMSFKTIFISLLWGRKNSAMQIKRMQHIDAQPANEDTGFLTVKTDDTQ